MNDLLIASDLLRVFKGSNSDHAICPIANHWPPLGNQSYSSQTPPLHPPPPYIPLSHSAFTPTSCSVASIHLRTPSPIVCPSA